MRALSEAEIKRFLAATHVASGEGRKEQQRRLFCRLLLYTGCLLSEGLEIRRCDIDIASSSVTITTIKPRNPKRTRILPIPTGWVLDAAIVFGLAGRQKVSRERRLWDMGRTTAWRAVKDAMGRADIFGDIATPLGLRHSFALRRLKAGDGLREVRDLLGNSSYESMLAYVTSIEQIKTPEAVE